MRNIVRQLHLRYDKVFNPTVPKYKIKCGKLEAVASMTSFLPPQRKGRFPSYKKDTLIALQAKFDKLQDVVICINQANVSISNFGSETKRK